MFQEVKSSPWRHLPLGRGVPGTAPRVRGFVLLLAHIPLAVVQLNALSKGPDRGCLQSCLKAEEFWHCLLSALLLAQLFLISVALPLRGRGREELQELGDTEQTPKHH